VPSPALRTCAVRRLLPSPHPLPLSAPPPTAEHQGLPLPASAATHPVSLQAPPAHRSRDPKRRGGLIPHFTSAAGGPGPGQRPLPWDRAPDSRPCPQAGGKGAVSGNVAREGGAVPGELHGSRRATLQGSPRGEGTPWAGAERRGGKDQGEAWGCTPDPCSPCPCHGTWGAMWAFRLSLT